MKPTNAGEDDGNRSEPAAVPLAATQQHDELVTLAAARSRGHQETLPDLELGPRGSGTLSLSQVIQLPQVLDELYVLEAKLGEGGMGIVYRAHHRLDGRPVALKLVRRPEISARGGTAASMNTVQPRLALAREFGTLSSLHHPNVVQVLDYGFDDQFGPYFTMELLEAPQTVIEAAAELPLDGKLALLIQLLRSLAYLHRRGIIHRDLKPHNVMCVGGVLKVVDFGLATRGATESAIVGTVRYIAPELWEGQPPTVASDLYAFGVIVYELLTDDFPERGNDGCLLRPRRFPRSPADPAVADALWSLLEALLATDAGARPASAGAVIDALGRRFGDVMSFETPETRESFLQASELIGRDREMAALSGALSLLLAGTGSCWLCHGESGVGKSRLFAELRTQALVHGAAVVHGHAVVEGGSSHHVWRPVLRALAMRAELADDDAGVLAAVLPELPDLLHRPIAPVPALPAAAAAERLFATIERLFRRQRRPTVIILEDLQWTGPDSLRLLADLASRVSSMPILIVGNYRDDEAPALAAAIPAQTFKVERLSRSAIRDLAASMIGDAGRHSELVDYLFRETEGNVFVLVEVLRELAEQAGELQRVDRVALPERVMTGGIEAFARRRVDRLPEPHRDLIELAAIAGRHLDLTVLRELVAAEPLDRWLRACANAAVLEYQDGWRFAHDKLREALIGAIPSSRRAELHLRVAQAIESGYVGAARDTKAADLAHHFEAAGDTDRAWRYSMRAGDLATRGCSYGDAREHYGRALTLSRGNAGDAGARQVVDTLLQQAYTTLVADDADRNFARMTDAQARLAEIAARGALGPEDERRMARVHTVLGRIHFYRGEIGQALAFYRQVQPVAEKLGDAELAALPSCLIGTACTCQGKLLDAEPLLARAMAPLERLGEPFEWFRAVGYHGLTLALMGRYRDACVDLDRVLVRAHEIGQPSLLSAAHLMNGTSRVSTGDWPRAVELLERVLHYATQTGDKLHLSLAHRGLAWALSQLGDAATAAEHRARGRAIADAMGGRLMLSDWYEASDAEAALAENRIDDAAAIGERVATTSVTADLVFSQGIAERVLARVRLHQGRDAEADACFAASIATLRRGGVEVQALFTELAWAECDHARGNRSRATQRWRELRIRAAELLCPYALADADARWLRLEST
ncbi:MAG TPA: AAA family ATPase [Kofleriaceae bacterium]|nr:AAA family ATPase [Kofleriaceae bacterium]